MDAYTEFAKFYSLMMQDIPYDKWEKFLIRTLKKHKIKNGLVLDLGCGTGEMTRRLKNAGYDMIGVDSSVDMLQEACKQSTEGILYLNQDMREFELYGTVRAIFSICDSMNYLSEYEDLVQVLKLANNYLDPGGIFVFDLKTAHFFRDVVKDETQAENMDDFSYIWENYYDKGSRIHEYDLTLFVKESEHYRKATEVHFQRAYTLTEIRKAAKEAGMIYLEALDADNYGAVTPGSERIYILLQECGK